MSRPSVEAAVPLVGRRSELESLVERLDAAIAGRGGVVLLAGEAGIGKTRLAEEVAACAAGRGVRVVWGRCYDGDGAPPFWPWVQVLRGLVDGGAAAPPLAHLGPAAALLSPVPPPSGAGTAADAAATALAALDTGGAESAQARFRLFEAVAAPLERLAAERPILLILDDLHWADASSLLLLGFLARTAHAQRLLVIAAYRDVEVGRDDPLAATLAALARERGHGALALRGVPPAAVALLAGEYGLDRSPAFATALHALTGGNPFFIRETLRHLAESGRLAAIVDAIERGGADGAAIEIPEGVRWVLRRRLGRVAPETARTLAVASVAGHDFDAALLAAAMQAPVLRAIEALDEAEAARLVSPVPGSGVGATLRYRFTHDLIRETLYGDLGRAARARLHHAIGRALEDRRRADPAPQIAQLAHHFVQAAPGGDVAKAVDYARRAAAVALDQYAYDEAARWYTLALEVLGGDAAADDALRGEILLAQGEALLLAGDARRVVESVAPAALALAEREGAAGDARAARACRLALNGIIRTSGPGTLVGTPAYRAWAERVDHHAPPETVDRVYADIAVADALSTRGALAETLALYRRALALARRLDDPDALFYAAFQLLNWSGGPSHQAERRRLAEEFSVRPRAGVQPRNAGRALWRCGAILLDWGERERAESLWREVAALAERVRERDLLLYAPLGDAILATLDGGLGEALRSLARLVERSAELGAAAYGLRYAVRLQERPLQLTGDTAAPPAALPPDLSPSETGDVWSPGNAAAAALRAAQRGETEAARRVLADALPVIDADRERDAVFPWHVVTLLELAVLLEDRPAAAALAARLAPLLPCATVDWGLTTAARHLGAAAALLGDRAGARDRYERALAAAAAVRFRPELALTRLALAELLHREFREHEAARLHLDEAIVELRSMGMRPALARALRFQDHRTPGRERRPRTPAADGLTAREAQVLRMLANGRSNREIADELVVSVRTVEHHIARIYAKIGARGRVDATAYALRHELGDAERTPR